MCNLDVPITVVLFPLTSSSVLFESAVLRQVRGSCGRPWIVIVELDLVETDSSSLTLEEPKKSDDVWVLEESVFLRAVFRLFSAKLVPKRAHNLSKSGAQPDFRNDGNQK